MEGALPHARTTYRMTKWAPLLATIVAVVSACGRMAEPALVDYRDPRTGFLVRYPAGWTITADPSGMTVRFVPPAFAQTSEAAPEFILVVTKPSESRLDEAGRRRAVFTLVPVHGVAGFQRDARSTGTMPWDRFEVTGASGSVEWASIGLVVAGDAGFHLVVCAKPLAQWRTGQKQCAQVIASFQPGSLQR